MTLSHRLRTTACLLLAAVAAASATPPTTVHRSLTTIGDSSALSAPHARLLPQRHFPRTVPPGNYSGIAWLGGDQYAVVSDKSAEDGFYIFQIDIDTVSGALRSARCTGFRSAGRPGRDDEGVAYDPARQTVYISGEDDNRICEHTLDGRATGREAARPECYRRLPANLSLEALSYNAATRRLWTCNESGEVWMTAFDDQLRPVLTRPYEMDAPMGDAARAWRHAHGIGTIAAMDDGSVLVLEREFHVPRRKIGAWVQCKLYQWHPDAASTDTLRPDATAKRLLASWRTHLTLTGRSLANYEGMCLGPTLADGSRVLVLVADSQNQYRGVLRDWIKTIVIEP